MTKIQFFTRTQVNTITSFIREMLDETLHDNKNKLFRSDEFAAKVVEFKKTKEYQKLLDRYNNSIELHSKRRLFFNSILELVGNKDAALSLWRVLENPSYVINANYNTSTIRNLTGLIPEADFDTWHCDYEKTEEEAKAKFDESLSDAIRFDVMHKYYKIVSYWDHTFKINAILSTMEACDESQAVDKVLAEVPTIGTILDKIEETELPVLS